MMKILISDIRQFDNDNSFAAAFDKVSKYRQDRINSLKQSDDKKRSLAAGLLLGYAMTASNIKGNIVPNEHGKPFFENITSFHFNISHSGNYSVIAYDSVAVGIDIQKFRPINDSVAKHFLSDNEYKCLSDDNIKRQDTLNVLWTIKEAYIKLLGIGLSYDMRNCSINIEASTISDSMQTAYFKHFELNIGKEIYNLTVCSQNNSFPHDYIFVKDFNSIVNL